MRIVNIVVSFCCSLELDPHKYPDYNSKRFSGAIVKIGVGKVLIFASKKFNVTGVTSVRDAKQIAEKLVGKDNITSKKIVNITASSKIKQNFDFQKLIGNQKFTWEPEFFPGIYWRKQKGKGPVIIFFRSKKVILTGVKKLVDVRTLYKEFLDDLKKLSL